MPWKFYLAQSNDLRNHLGEIQQGRSRSVSLVHNRAGSLSFTHPMTDEMAALIQPITTAVKAYRWIELTQQWKCVWSGPVWTVDESISEERMTVNCVGWLEILNHRLLRMDKNYVAQDDADIIFDLLAEANKTALPDFTSPTYPVPIPAGSWPNTPTRIIAGSKKPNFVGGTNYSATTRNFNVQKYASIGQTIQQLTDIENGCDIWIDPETREFNIYRKKSKPTTQVFGYNWGPGNLQGFQRQLDASTVTNMMVAFGSAGSSPGYADSSTFGAEDTRLTYGLFEEVQNLGIPLSATAIQVLETYAAGEVLVRKTPKVTYTMSPFPYTPENAVPEPFGEYEVGDSVLLTAKLLPRISIQNQRIRVFGMTVNIDEDGNEKLGSLQTSPGG